MREVAICAATSHGAKAASAGDQGGGDDDDDDDDDSDSDSDDDDGDEAMGRGKGKKGKGKAQQQPKSWIRRITKQRAKRRMYLTLYPSTQALALRIEDATRTKRKVHLSKLRLLWDLRMLSSLRLGAADDDGMAPAFLDFAEPPSVSGYTYGSGRGKAGSWDEVKGDSLLPAWARSLGLPAFTKFPRVELTVNRAAFLTALEKTSRARRGRYLLAKLTGWLNPGAAPMPAAPAAFQDDGELDRLRAAVEAQRAKGEQFACLTPTRAFLDGARTILRRYTEKNADGVRLHPFPLVCPTCGEMRVYDRYGRLVLERDRKVVHFHCSSTTNVFAGKLVEEIIGLLNERQQAQG